MTVIRVIFDGKTFVPQQPLSLPTQSEALVVLDHAGPAAQAQLDAAIRAYYQAAPQAGDAEDEAWTGVTSPRSERAWDED